MVANSYHRPVLLEESLAQLALCSGARVVDATVGGGGHAAAMLQQIGPDGELIGFDVDEEAIACAGRRLADCGGRARLVRRSFRELEAVVVALGAAPVHAVLFDLGVSSRQFDEPRRGFRFASESARHTPLDMRMDQRLRTGAAELLARASAAQLELLFRNYGELPGAKRLARTIVEQRTRRPLRTAADLLDVVAIARVGHGRRHNPATLVFQALRMAVNDELGALAEGLAGAIAITAPGGRIAVIAYHSLEDRAVKHTFRTEVRGCVCPPALPVCRCGRPPRLELLTRRPLRPSVEEIRDNPRSRSARLRAAARLVVAS